MNLSQKNNNLLINCIMKMKNIFCQAYTKPSYYELKDADAIQIVDEWQGEILKDEYFPQF